MKQKQTQQEHEKGSEERARMQRHSLSLTSDKQTEANFG